MADAEAEVFARAHGARLEHPDEAGRLAGGHLADRDRGGRQAQLARLASRQGLLLQSIAARTGRTLRVESGSPQGHRLRYYAEWIVARREAIVGAVERLEGERSRLERWARILDLMFSGDGASQSEIGRAIGLGRQRVNRELSEILDAAQSVQIVDPVIPDCAKCGQPLDAARLEARIKRGRGKWPKYHKKCGVAVAVARWRARQTLKKKARNMRRSKPKAVEGDANNG